MLTIALRLMLIDCVELSVQKKIDQIQGQFVVISKSTYTVRFDHPVEGDTSQAGTVSKVSTNPSNIHKKLIYTRFPWPFHGWGACRASRNVPDMLWLPGVYLLVHR